MTEKDKVFIKVTNREVYAEIQALRRDVNKALLSAKINAAVISAIISILCAVISRILI